MLYTPSKNGRSFSANHGRPSAHSGIPTSSEFALKGYLIRYLSLGKEKFRSDGRFHYLSGGEYIILNPGEVAHTIEEASKGIWIEIPKNYLNRELALLSAEAPQHWELLKNEDKQALHLCDHVYEASMDSLGELLISLGKSESFEENSLQSITQALLESQRSVFEKISRLNSAKMSTRTELFRRIYQAQTYIHNNLDKALDLDTLSQVACLSKYHFIRLFKEVYGETPRQYLIKRRLERAKHLLISSKKTFHEICHEVGLKDSSSFGRLFKRSFGSTPQIFRQTYTGS